VEDSHGNTESVLIDMGEYEEALVHLQTSLEIQLKPGCSS
jgi:hypothetical protein